MFEIQRTAATGSYFLIGSYHFSVFITWKPNSVSEKHFINKFLIININKPLSPLKRCTHFTFFCKNTSLKTIFDTKELSVFSPSVPTSEVLFEFLLSGYYCAMLPKEDGVLSSPEWVSVNYNNRNSWALS